MLWKRKLIIGVWFYLKSNTIVPHKLCEIVFSLGKFSWNILQQRPAFPIEDLPMSPIMLGFAVHPESCMSLDTELRHWSWQRRQPREGGPGVHLRISVSFFTWASLLCSPLKSPSILPVTALALPVSFLLPFHSFRTTQIPTPQFRLHTSASIFLFFVPQTKLTIQLYPMHHNIVWMFQSSKVTTNVKTGKQLQGLVKPGWRNPSQKQDKVTSQLAVSWLTMISYTDLTNQQFLPNIVFRRKIGNI